MWHKINNKKVLFIFDHALIQRMNIIRKNLTKLQRVLVIGQSGRELSPFIYLLTRVYSLFGIIH